MVTEIAQIDVKPGNESRFEEGVKRAKPLLDVYKRQGRRRSNRRRSA